MQFAKTLSLCVASMLGATMATGCRSPKGAAASQLLKTDAAFAQLVANEGAAKAFRDFAAPDAVTLPQGADPIIGRELIFQSLRDDSGTLTWTPQNADISRGGDLGYTWGYYQYRSKSLGPIHYGKYLTVWKKQPDKSWKFVADIGNPSPSPK